jgi:tripartite ATP-independent transporter DctM subunit
VTARKRNYPKGDPFKLIELLRSGRFAFMTFLLPIVLVGSILVGIATPTEAATMGVIYAIVLGVSYRALRVGSLFDSLVDVGVLTAVILLVVSTSNTLGVLAGLEGFGPRLTEGLLAISDNPIILLFLINGAMLILGLAIEPLPLTLVMLPLLFPVITQVGIDPIHFGVVVTLNLMLALLTPPVAMLTFITSSIADADVGAAMRASMPMFWALVGVLVLITAVPDLVTWLPGLMGS